MLLNPAKRTDDLMHFITSSDLHGHEDFSLPRLCLLTRIESTTGMTMSTAYHYFPNAQTLPIEIRSETDEFSAQGCETPRVACAGFDLFGGVISGHLKSKPRR